MRIAVTGGRGRLGRAVVDLALARGYEVVEIDWSPVGAGTAPAGLHRAGLRPVVADVRAYHDLLPALAGCAALVHLAAHPTLAGHPAHEVHDDNVTGSYHALCAAAESGIDRVCLASSVNAIGGFYSRAPRYDCFPVDERHPSYVEDPYGLSKWIAEAQADSVARRYGAMTITSLRLHGVVPDLAVHRRQVRADPAAAARHLWGYTLLTAAAMACLLAVSASFTGHEVCYVVAPGTGLDVPSADLHRRHYPEVPLRRPLAGTEGFFDTGKAARLLGWHHDPA